MRIKQALPAALTATALLLTGAVTATSGTATAATSVTSVSVTAQADITRAKAIRIAKKALPGGRVTKVEREFEHGHRTWKVVLHKGHLEYRVYVAIKTGKIIKLRIKN